MYCLCFNMVSLILGVKRSSGYAKGGNFIYPMMHRFILYYQASERT